MKIKKLFIIFLVLLLCFSGLPPFNKAVSAESSKVVKTNIEVPDPLKTINGESWLTTEWSPDLGTVDISTVLPTGAKVSSVQLLDMQGNYVKHLNDHTGNVYKIGKLENVGNQEVISQVSSGIGYFEWFRQGGSNRTWAFDLDGVRHVRMYDSSVDYPMPNARYINIREGTGGVPATSHIEGNIPTWYTPPTPNHGIVFIAEIQGAGDVGWSERKIDISNAVFSSTSLGLENIPMSKLSNIQVTPNDVKYKRDGSYEASIYDSDITHKLVMDDGPTMLANKEVRIWFGAYMRSNFYKNP